MNELLNTVPVCKNCVEERRIEFQELIKSGKISLSDITHIKTSFKSDSGQSENMWVEVTNIKDGVVTGILDNDPLLTFKNLKCGDKVSFLLSKGIEGFSEVIE